MKTRTVYWVACLIIILDSCSPSGNAPGIRYPCRWPGSPGFSGNIDASGIVEPSGICFHPLRKTLFVVGDEGEIIEIRKDGRQLFRQSVCGDLEGVTVDPGTGLLYIVVEGDDVILEFDPGRRIVRRRFPVDRSFNGNPEFLQKQRDRYDNGLESLAFVPDENHAEGGTFFSGNQDDPPCVLEIEVPLRSAAEETAEARILRILPFKMDDPSGMAYDSGKKTLAVISDADNVFAEITLDGKILAQYAFPGNDQEGIAWDDEGYLYITQDSGGILKLKDMRGR